MHSSLHKDTRDIVDGWVALMAVGNYTGGALQLPELGKALHYGRGDLLYLRAAALAHEVADFEGEQFFLLVLVCLLTCWMLFDFIRDKVCFCCLLSQVHGPS